jgi:hypothetical protein
MSSLIESAREDHPDVPPPIGGRTFSAQGVAWSVYEDRSWYIGPSLIFESEKIARRVRNYPMDWRRLSDEQLTALSWSR